MDPGGDQGASCADDTSFTDGAGNPCWYYRGWGCEADVISGAGGTAAAADLKALCPLSCGICSGEHRATNNYVDGTCPWDATYPFSECCATEFFINAAGADCAFGGECRTPSLSSPS